MFVRLEHIELLVASNITVQSCSSLMCLNLVKKTHLSL